MYVCRCVKLSKTYARTTKVQNVYNLSSVISQFDKVCNYIIHSTIYYSYAHISVLVSGKQWQG